MDSLKLIIVLTELTESYYSHFRGEEMKVSPRRSCSPRRSKCSRRGGDPERPLLAATDIHVKSLCSRLQNGTIESAVSRRDRYKAPEIEETYSEG